MPRTPSPQRRCWRASGPNARTEIWGADGGNGAHHRIVVPSGLTAGKSADVSATGLGRTSELRERDYMHNPFHVRPRSFECPNGFPSLILYTHEQADTPLFSVRRNLQMR